MTHIGFMQGRLSPLVDGRIQAFPWNHWREEFPLARQLDLPIMEWTLDHDRLYENPLMTLDGQAEIRVLCSRYELAIPSLTGDCFMQAPFWKADGVDREGLWRDFLAVVQACSVMDIRFIVIPLVDNGALETREQEDTLVEFLVGQADLFQERGVAIVFESDFASSDLKRFIDRLPDDIFGINYDIGNSAALSYLFEEEFEAYGSRILNVHVKDRILGGATVPLGTGDARLPETIAALEQLGYGGNYILQSARATDHNHAGVLSHYRDMVQGWMEQAQ